LAGAYAFRSPLSWLVRWLSVSANCSRDQICPSTPLTVFAVLFGYDQGVFSGIVGNQDWKDVFHNPGSALEGIIVSIYNLGAFAGCIVTFFIAERLGRRMCMWFAMIWIVRHTWLRESENGD